MVPGSSCAFSKRRFDEISRQFQELNDIGQLKLVIDHFIKENVILSQRLKVALKTVTNQYKLIKYLKKENEKLSETPKHLKTMLSILDDIGQETLRSIENFYRYRSLALGMLNNKSFQKIDKEKLMQDYKKAFCAMPSEYVKDSRVQFVHVLAKLADGGYNGILERVRSEEDGEIRKKTVNSPESATQRKKIKTALYNFQNNKINFLNRNRKQCYRIKAKKNACRTSRKQSYKNLQTNKSENTPSKNFGSSTLINSEEMCESVQSKKYSRRQKYKRKIDEVNEESLNSDNEISQTVTKLSVKKTRLNKKKRNSYISDNESFSKPCSVPLVDFMIHSSQDDDPFIAQYKQECGCKGNEAIEYEIVDEAGDDIDSDQRAESDPNSKNNDEELDNDENNRLSTKSKESDVDLEEDADISELIESEEHKAEPPINALHNGKKGPCTPPHSPTPDNYFFRRGPRTPPPYPSPETRRGPHTPTFTSDSEGVDGCYSKIHKETQTTDRLYVNNFMKGLQELLQSGEHSDVILNVKGTEFSVHRAILSAHSPVFRAMMMHDTKEKAIGIINIDYCDPNTFSNFVDFMYSGRLDFLDSENVFNLFTVADKYQVKELCDVCLMYMVENISVETVCDIMALSLRYDNKYLSMATNYFVDKSEDVLQTSKWLVFLKDNPEAANELILTALKSKSH